MAVNGYEYRSTVAVMGGRHLIPFSSDKRAATGIQGGDPIVVDVEVDTAPRTVEVPDDLAAALDQHPAVRAAFTALSYSNQRQRAEAVAAAKQPETRARRIEKIIAELS